MGEYMKCKNCGAPIKPTRWSFGPKWTHVAAMTDNQIACISTTIAEPALVGSGVASNNQTPSTPTPEEPK